MSQRFRRLTDLFVQGSAVKLPDDTYLWVQVINAYERDECINDAQVARARLVLALKENGSERVKVEARLAEKGRDTLISDLADVKTDLKYPEIVSQIEADDEWREKVGILRRHAPDEAATPLTEDEIALVASLGEEWLAEINKRVADERDYQLQYYNHVDDEVLLEDYLEAWLDRRGGEVANAEYSLTELWYATRYCDAAPDGDGALDHARCVGHPHRVFPTKADARAMPDDLKGILVNALAGVGMNATDPKGSGKPESSSGSSPTPSGAAASTPSTSTATHNAPPGT